jgi:hypothetical protein
MPELSFTILIPHAKLCTIFGGRRYLPAVELGDCLRLLEHLDIRRELLIAIWVAPHRVLQTYTNIDTEHCCTSTPEVPPDARPDTATAAKQEMEHYHFLADLNVQPKWDIPSRIAINAR